MDIPQRQRRDYCYFKGNFAGNPFKEGPKERIEGHLYNSAKQRLLGFAVLASAFAPLFERQYSLCWFRGLHCWSFQIASTESGLQMLWWPLDILPSETVFPSLKITLPLSTDGLHIPPSHPREKSNLSNAIPSSSCLLRFFHHFSVPIYLNEKRRRGNKSRYFALYHLQFSTNSNPTQSLPKSYSLSIKWGKTALCSARI